MKRILTLIALVFSIATANAQFQSTEVQFSKTSHIRIETYADAYCYLNNQDTSDTRLTEVMGFPVRISATPFTLKYASYTPGQLIYRSGALKNFAITTSILCGLSSSVLIGCSFMTNNPMAMYIPGAIIGGAGFITTVALLSTSNKLLKEAGLKMERIQFSANGMTVKF